MSLDLPQESDGRRMIKHVLTKSHPSKSIGRAVRVGMFVFDVIREDAAST